MTFHIGYHNFADFDGVTVTGLYTDAGYDVADVVDRHRHTWWQGTNASPQKVRFDLGSAGPETFDGFRMALDLGLLGLNGTLPMGSQTEQANCRASTLTITVNHDGGSIPVTDDGAGNLSGTGVTGTINYITGAYSVDFSPALDNVILDATFEYDRMVKPTFLAVVDGFRNGRDVPLQTLSIGSYTGAWSGGVWGLSVEPYWNAGVLFSADFGAPNPRRYWEIVWPMPSASAVQGASVVMLGKVLTLGEGMAAGFDMGARKLVVNQKRDRAGGFLPSVIEGVEQTLKLKLPAAGLAYSELEHSPSKGLVQTPSIDRFLRSYWSRGIPVALQWKAFDFDDSQSFWARGRGSVATPFISSIRRGLTLEFDVIAELHAEADT